MQAVQRQQLPAPPLPALDGDAGHWGGSGLRRLRAARRIAAILAFTALAIPVQAVCLRLPGRPKVAFARFYWAVLCRLAGLRVRVLGNAATPGAGRGARPVVFASNHSSYLDVLVLGGALEACFVAKEEVGTWPLIRTVARLGRTVFVSRRARETGRERDAMRARLDAGDNLVLFPEGTSSDGSRVLPFRSAFFSVVEGAGPPPWVQPVSVVYDQLGGLPAGRATRVVFAWYGDMELGSHCWQLLQHRGLRATLLLHPPLDPAAIGSRKALSAAAWATVADGAATLRQNRPVKAFA